MPDTFINNPNYYKGTNRENRVVPHMFKKDSIVNAVQRIGYQPEEIQVVINSHLHVDHSGGNQHFRHSSIVIQQAEYDVAIGNDDYAPLECRLPDLQYQMVTGDHELFPDVQLLFTPGHSPGHQSILVTTEKSEPILLTIDVACTKENFEKAVPFFGFDQKMAKQSIHRMHDIIRDIRPTLVFSDMIENKYSTFVYFHTIDTWNRKQHAILFLYLGYRHMTIKLRKQVNPKTKKYAFYYKLTQNFVWGYYKILA